MKESQHNHNETLTKSSPHQDNHQDDDIKKKKKDEKEASPTRSRTMRETTNCLCFQDVLQSHQDKEGEQEEGEDDISGAAAANCFFELANATHVSYRIDDNLLHYPTNNNKKDNKKDNKNRKKEEDWAVLKIRQDHHAACGQHTGGIVWETSYLLLNYLRQRRRWQRRRESPPCCHGSPSTDEKTRDNAEDPHAPDGDIQTVLEVGAGCGLLGIGIYHSKLAKRVILTETDSVLSNLTYNVQQNNHIHNKNKINHTNNNNTSQTHLKAATNESMIRVCELDWTRYKEDCGASTIEPHSIDLIVGTDVVFSTRFVRPLLETLRYLAHSHTQILLCLQERCPDSHRLLLESAREYGLTVRDISEQVTDVPSCEWGKELECCILELRVAAVKDEEAHTQLETPVESARKRRKREVVDSLRKI
jgi:predicted nicotinamide N-methyase